jgi:MFS family permease
VVEDATAARRAPRAVGDRAASALGIFDEEPYNFSPAEQSMVTGGPARPSVSPSRRRLYGLVGVLLGLSGGLNNALVTVNLPYLLGALGADASEAAWVSVAYSMTYISMNLLLVKFRQQFGLRLFAMLALTGFCLVILLHLLAHGLAGATVVHAFAGVATAPFTTMSVYYLMASLPPAKAVGGVIAGLGLSQVPTFLARLFSPELLANDQWRSLYLFEFGLALLCLSAVALLRLPPSQRVKAFEPLDFITFPMFAVGAALLCAVLGLGRIDWWTDRPWLGWALAGSIIMLAAALYVEWRRTNPLLDLRWLTAPDIVRLTVIVFVSKIVLSEQSVTAIGLLSTLGVTNDELHLFSLVLTVASICGVAAAMLLVRPNRLIELGALAIGMVAVGAFLDSHATNLTGPEQLYASQALIAFATTLFIGPALLFGLTFVLQQRGRPLTSYLVLFVVLQTLGSLAGSALLGSFQEIREKAASAELARLAPPDNPIVAARLRAGAGAVSPVVGDPEYRTAEGVNLLQTQASREASVLAYDQTFTLVAAVAAATTVYLAFLLARRWLRSAPPKTAVFASHRRPVT